MHQPLNKRNPAINANLSLYVLVSIVLWSFGLIRRLYQVGQHADNSTLATLAAIFSPLHGFVNCAVYSFSLRTFRDYLAKSWRAELAADRDSSGLTQASSAGRSGSGRSRQGLPPDRDSGVLSDVSFGRSQDDVSSVIEHNSFGEEFPEDDDTAFSADLPHSFSAPALQRVALFESLLPYDVAAYSKSGILVNKPIKKSGLARVPTAPAEVAWSRVPGLTLHEEAKLLTSAQLAAQKEIPARRSLLAIVLAFLGLGLSRGISPLLLKETTQEFAPVISCSCSTRLSCFLLQLMSNLLRTSVGGLLFVTTMLTMRLIAEKSDSLSGQTRVLFERNGKFVTGWRAFLKVRSLPDSAFV